MPKGGRPHQHAGRSPVGWQAEGPQVEIAAKIVSHGADYLLPLKGNEPTLEADVEAYFQTAPASECVTKTTVEKGGESQRLRHAERVMEWRTEGMAALRRGSAPLRISSVKSCPTDLTLASPA